MDRALARRLVGKKAHRQLQAYLGPPNLRAAGPISSVVALIACAIRPTGASLLQTNGLLDSLGRLIDWPQDYSKMPSLFCFGLLAEFDINDLIELAAPLPLSDGARGPLR